VNIHSYHAHDFASSLYIGSNAGYTATTDSRSRRIRADRRGGQIKARALSPLFYDGLPALTCFQRPKPGWSHHTPIRRSAEYRSAEAIMPDKGKVERPFRYVREDFFLGGSFRNLDDLNEQLRRWLDEVANPRVHTTTQRVVNEAFAEERPSLKPLPASPYSAVLKLGRRISHEGMVSAGGNFYSVPDTTRRRVLDVHVLADTIRIFEEGALVASHAPLEGRGQKRLDPTHRKVAPPPCRRPAESQPIVLQRAGQPAARRPLAFYEAVGRRLASQGVPR
jgi:hypothetical protein